MKKNEIEKLRTEKLKDFNKTVNEKRLELIKVKASIKTSREKNLKKAKNLRRDIAQMLTLIREKELIGSEAKKPRFGQKENRERRKEGEKVKNTDENI